MEVGKLTKPTRFGRVNILRGALLLGAMFSLLHAASALADATNIGGPTGPTKNQTPTFTFESGPEDPPDATFECRVDADAFAACDSPFTVPTPLAEGTHTFEVQVVGQASPPASRSFTVDITPPTTIVSGPSGITSDDTPTYTFSSDDPNATFECRFDDAVAFSPCDSPLTPPSLADGPHTFRVQAVDQANNTGTPASRSFTVDTTPPTTTIEFGPTGAITDPTPTLVFSSTDPNATFECRVDDAVAFSSCDSPLTLPSLAEGPHTFRVRAVDQAANPDPSPASQSFTVDTTPPTTTIDSGPSGTTSDDSPTFTFSSGDPDATFECRVDADAFSSCDSPLTLPSLADGPHSFEVRAVDQAANRDPNPASRAFSVDTVGPPDTTAPDTKITKRPKSRIKTKKKQAKVTVSFSSEPGATYRCKLDKSEYRACTSPYSVKARSGGGKGRSHTISIEAIDEAGNIGEPATVRFKLLRKQRRLQGSVARHTVVVALKRHGFARRVVKSVHVDCRRRSSSAFMCRFSGRFPGYRLKGRGPVKLGTDLSYRFRVKAQGVRFTLTDKNESQRSQ